VLCFTIIMRTCWQRVLIKCVVNVTYLFQLCLTAPEPVSQTKNEGSIKAMFASRAQAKATKNHVLPDNNAETDSSKLSSSVTFWQFVNFDLYFRSMYVAVH